MENYKEFDFTPEMPYRPYPVNLSRTAGNIYKIKEKFIGMLEAYRLALSQSILFLINWRRWQSNGRL